MVYAEKYNKDKTYYFQDGHYADYAALKALFPALDDLTWIVFTDYTGNVIISFEIINLKRTELNIDTSLSDDEAVAAIVQKMNTPEQ